MFEFNCNDTLGRGLGCDGAQMMATFAVRAGQERGEKKSLRKCKKIASALLTESLRVWKAQVPPLRQHQPQIHRTDHLVPSFKSRAAIAEGIIRTA